MEFWFSFHKTQSNIIMRIIAEWYRSIECSNCGLMVRIEESDLKMDEKDIAYIVCFCNVKNKIYSLPEMIKNNIKKDATN